MRRIFVPIQQSDKTLWGIGAGKRLRKATRQQRAADLKEEIRRAWIKQHRIDKEFNARVSIAPKESKPNGLAQRQTNGATPGQAGNNGRTV